MLTKDLAICIRAHDFSETSQIVTFFARETGKIRAIAKGSKRAKSSFGGTIEMFSHGKIVYSNSNKEKLATLTEFEQEPSFIHISGNLFALNACLFGAELLNNLTDEYDAHPGLFDSFEDFLQNANEKQAREDGRRGVLALLILFQLALLKEVGLRPILNYCVNCRNIFSPDWRQAYFSSTANGLICRDCESSFPDKMSLSKDAAVCLSSLKQIAKVNEKTLDEIERLLIYHFTETLGRQPKMAKHVLKA